MVEIVRHAALALNAPLKRNGGEIALQVVGPVVIDAGQPLDRAAFLDADEIAAMGAAIDHRVEGAGLITHNDNWDIAHHGCLEIAGFGNFTAEAEETPGGALKDLFLLLREDRFIRINGIGDFAEIVRVPVQRHHGVRLSGRETLQPCPGWRADPRGSRD